MSTEKQPEALAGSTINRFCGNCKDGYPGGTYNCGKCHSHSQWTPLFPPSAQAVAVLPDPLGHCVDGRVFVGRIPAHVQTLVDTEDWLPIKLYTEKQMRALKQSEPVRMSLPAHRNRRIYVAGPMTGLPEFNFPAFNSTASMLRAEGWHVENPAEHGIVDGAEWTDYLHYDLGRLATCCAIYLLPGWSKSRGAALEVYIARALGMEFYYDDDAEIEAAPQQSPQFVIDLP